jgi:hypothetical protein
MFTTTISSLRRALTLPTWTAARRRESKCHFPPEARARRWSLQIHPDDMREATIHARRAPRVIKKAETESRVMVGKARGQAGRDEGGRDGVGVGVGGIVAGER